MNRYMQDEKLVPLQYIQIIFMHFITGHNITMLIQFESSLGTQENQLIRPSHALNLMQEAQKWKNTDV